MHINKHFFSLPLHNGTVIVKVIVKLFDENDKFNI